MDKTMQSYDFRALASSILNEAGIAYEYEQGDPAADGAFGDATAVFRVSNFLLRLVRDRGQIFADIAASTRPDRFFQMDDLDVALGISNQLEIVARSEPEDIRRALARLNSLRDTYSAALTPESLDDTMRAVAAAAKCRGKLMLSQSGST